MYSESTEAVNVPPHALVAVHAVDRDGQGQVNVCVCIAVAPNLVGRRAKRAHGKLHDQHDRNLQVDKAVKAPWKRSGTVGF